MCKNISRWHSEIQLYERDINRVIHIQIYSHLYEKKKRKHIGRQLWDNVQFATPLCIVRWWWYKEEGNYILSLPASIIMYCQDWIISNTLCLASCKQAFVSQSLDVVNLLVTSSFSCTIPLRRINGPSRGNRNRIKIIKLWQQSR